MVFCGRPYFDIKHLLLSSPNESIDINIKKWKNFQTFLEFIPPNSQHFYQSMRHESKKAKNKRRHLQFTQMEEEFSKDNIILYSYDE